MFRFTRTTRYALGGFAASVAIYPLAAPKPVEYKKDVLLENASFASLLRTWIVYKSCDFPFFVHHAEGIISTLNSIPLINSLAKVGLRQTIFPQFCGGESVTECLREIARLREVGIGSILHYSVEAAEAEGAHVEHGNVPEAVVKHAAHSRQETSEGIDLLANGTPKAEDRAWLCVKLTGLTDANLLYEVSQALRKTGTRTDVPYPHTPDEQTKAALGSGSPTALATLPVCETLDDLTRDRFVEFYQQLRQLAAQAKGRGVRLMIDSEQSWYQPAMDLLQMALAAEFNRPAENEPYIPTVYATSQCYLARNNEHLRSLLEHAKKNQYTLAIKLVRGAYMENERYFAAQHGDESPIVPDKATADEQYDESSKYLLESITESPPSVAYMAATHNEKSAVKVIEYLDGHGLVTKDASGLRRLKPEIQNRVHFAQLFGMSDDLTSWIAQQFESTNGPIVTKYLPYGPMDEVIPYLCRRVADNSSILNGDRGAAFEADRIWQELRSRIGL